MKVIVLGGAGEMAKRAVQDLVTQDDVERLTIADINTDAANELALSLKDDRVDVSTVDVMFHKKLVDTIREYDVVASAVGPFYLFEKKVVDACIEAGVHCTSICDDHDAVYSVLPLDEKARQKKVKVMTGMGWTPGMSNLLARKGYEEMDEIDVINIYWGGSANDSEGAAVILHTLHIFDGYVPSFKNGDEIQVKAGSSPEPVDFVSPMGRVRTFNLGHPEPITIPRYLPDVKNVTLKGGLKESYLNNFMKFLSKARMTNSPIKKDLLGKAFKKSMPMFHRIGSAVSFSSIRVDVHGYKNGARTTITYQAVDNMHNLTGIPLSIGALMLGRGEIKRMGVFAPEADGAVKPDKFIKELEKRNIDIHRQEESGIR